MIKGYRKILIWTISTFINLTSFLTQSIVKLLFVNVRKHPDCLMLKKVRSANTLRVAATNPQLSHLFLLYSGCEMTVRCPTLDGLKLIVFDLDYTLWPYHVDSTVSLPFYVQNSVILDQSGQEIKPFPEASTVLNYLTEHGFTIAAASRTTKPPAANQLLDLFGWNKYFALKEIYPGCKTTHFKRFKDQTNLEFNSMIFFDDEQRNIQEVSQLGVKCILVQGGMNMKLLHEALNLSKN